MLSCLPGQHPRLRWNRRRRSLDMRTIRSKFLLANYRHLQRYVAELMDQPVHHERRKRSNYSPASVAGLFGMQKRQRFHEQPSFSHKRVLRTLETGDTLYREVRQPFQGEEEYAKFMKSIRQRYQRYVKNILGHNTIRGNQSLGSNEYSRHRNDNESTEFIAKETEFHKSNQDTSSAYLHHQQPTTGPTKYPFNVNYRPAKKKVHPKIGEKAYNKQLIKTGPREGQENDHLYSHNQYRQRTSASNRPLKKPLVVDYMAQLKRQMVRRKRNADEEPDTRSDRSGKQGAGRKNGRRNLNVTTVATTVAAAEDGGDAGEMTDGQKRGKPKSPCDVSICYNASVDEGVSQVFYIV